MQRCEAAKSLAMTGDDTDIRRLRSLAAGDPSVLVRTCSLGAAGRLGDDTALDALAAQLRNGTIEGRTLAADALTLMNTPEVVQPLADALTDFPVGRDYPNPALRALIGLGDLARPELLGRLSGASTEEQTLIARALASIGTSADVDALSQAMEGARQEETRAALRDAIASIRYRDARSE
jgi:HEAT repeat protein